MSARAAQKTRQQLAEAWRLFQSGDTAAAESALRAILRRAPRDPDALGFLGSLLMQKGQPGDAVTPLRRAVGVRPGDPALLYNLGSALAAAGKLREAADALRQCVDADPAQPDAWVNFGNVLQELDDRRGAITCYQRALDQAPDLVEPRSNMGAALLYEGRLEEAEDVLRAALSRRADNAAAWNNLGSVLKSRGDLESAADALRRALEVDPGMAEAMANLLDIDPDAGDADDAASLSALVGNEGHTAADRIAAGFAAGRIYARLKLYDDAFAAFSAGNRLRAAADRNRGLGFDRQAHSALVDGLIEQYSIERLAARGNASDADTTPIFVLGMPRSGTTLVEQIISSHPAVAGAGEVPFLAEVVAAAGGPTAPAELSEADARRLGAEYLSKLRAIASDEAVRITDKTPTNFLHIGAISYLLPGARIIHCRRDAADTCLSCFFQNFGRGHGFTNDLVDLGSYYQDYRRLTDHWHAALPDAVQAVDYETLVADPEPVIRGMLAFAGLDWDPACLDFHKNPRSVLTASNAQVRRKLYGTSVARWRPYADHLGPLFAALGPDAPAPASPD